jgi:hypothetical protein
MSFYSGRLDKSKRQIESDDTDLLRAIARNEPLKQVVQIDPKLKRYAPIFKHPLPLSEYRASHESVLRRVLSCSIEKQIQAAVTLNNAWVLEEVMNTYEHKCTEKLF